MKFIIAFLLIFNFLYATDKKESIAKAVFDCKIRNLDVIDGRLALMLRTIRDFELKDKKYDFVVTIHSYCTPIAEDGTKNEKMKKIQEKLELLSLQEVDIRVCNIAMNRYNYKRENILDYISIADNSWVDVIELQNSGYALMNLE